MRVIAVALVALVALSCVSAFEHDFVQSYDQEVYQAKPHFVKHLDSTESASMRFAETHQKQHEPVPMPAGPEPAAAKEGGESHEDKVSSLSTACGREIDCDSEEVKKSDAKREGHMASIESDGEKERELDEALQTVKDEIVQKATQIRNEKKWVKEVTKVVESYVKKIRRVNSNIREMQTKVKELFRKKKQIENLKLQRKLELKLKVATKDLGTLQDALTNVHDKESAFVKSKKDIRGTIGAIEDQLKKLRGEEAEKEEENADDKGKDKEGDKDAEKDDKAKKDE